jgi:AcrR family transcriptional regulator
MFIMSTSKPRGAYHHGALRAALIAAAVDAIETEGPEGLTLRSLADKAGVSAMAPYRHFADKAALLEAAATEGFRRLRAACAAVDDPRDARKALTAFGIVYVEFAATHPGLFRLMFGGPPPTRDDGLADDPDTVMGLIAARIAEIVAPPRRRDAMLAAWSAMYGLATLVATGRLRGPKEKPAKLAARVAAVLFEGL